MRINKLFSNYGICSRRETNELIQEKRIKINGEFCVLGQWIEDSDEILLDNKPISQKEKIYIAFNKPFGVTCTAKKEIKNNIIKFINFPQYIFPVGRLDKESQGLMLLTNDGELANEIIEGDNKHEKEYIVTVNKKINEDFINKLANGIEILCKGSSGIKRISDKLGIFKDDHNKKLLLLNDDANKLNYIELKSLSKSNKNKYVMTRPCFVAKMNDNTFRIILTQGLNRQIRKMCSELNYKVTKLERIRIMNINIGNLEMGKWRYLQEEEILELKKMYKTENN